MKEQLPGFVIAELFSKSLVLTDELTPVASKNIEKTQSWFLGGYEKKIIVIVNDADNIHLGDENLQFLAGILAACNLSLAHVALINFNRHAVTHQQLKKEMQPQFALLFGVSALQIELPFIMPDYKVQNYDNCSFLTAPPLQSLNQDSDAAKKEKGKLWNSIRKMF